MSASILRNLVSSVFKTPAHKIILSGELAPDEKWHHKTGVVYVTEEEYIKVWGFNSQNGFENITNQVVGTTHYYNGNHNSTYSPAPCTLAEASVDKNYIFFVVLNEGVYRDGEEYCFYTLYKAPNFAAHWAAIEEADIKRWEEWVKA